MIQSSIGKSQTAQNFLSSQSAAVEKGVVEYRPTASQFEIIKVSTDVEQTRRRTLLIEPNYLMVQVVIQGASLITSRARNITHLAKANALSLFRAGEYWIRDGVGTHASYNLIVPCPKETITAVQIGQKLESESERVVNLSSFEAEQLIRSLECSAEYFSLANAYFAMLARAFVGEALVRPTHTSSESVLGRLCQDVNANLSADWTSSTAAIHSGYSIYHFSRIFKEEYGVGFHRYLEEQRVHKAAELMIRGYHNPEIVCQEVGFSNRNKLASAIREYLGLSFVDFREVQRAA